MLIKQKLRAISIYYDLLANDSPFYKYMSYGTSN